MATRRRKASRPLTTDPLWYKDAIIYELHVRAFADSDGDGVGDFRGLSSRLDYLHELGITAIWLLPFYPSPLRDDGYDITDYYDVHSRYGTLQDFEAFLHEAHRRDIRVITELVINHTSDQHDWFQRARRAKQGSRQRDFYVWSDTPERYADARIIFKDFEHSNWTYDPVARAYFWHRFYSHQPDLNFESPAVRKAVFDVLDFWLDMGVDGLRLDAVPYLFEREGTDCENLDETHAFLKELRQHVEARYPDRMLLAEANQWPEDAAAYFGDDDECHMNFHFPLMPRLFMALQMEDRFPVTDILAQTPVIGEKSQWALFLRNHDELTLEMVTDEERDYMYRVYALDAQARINLGIRRRLAPLLQDNRNAIELMNAFLMSLPGTPVLYYGDELGMGDNIYLGDRNGVRTPMQWSADRNAGFSRANPQSLYLPVIIDPEFHHETVNVEAQRSNPNSLLWFMRGLISLRKRSKAFGRGDIVFLEPENRKVLAFVRRYGDEAILVVGNLSRFVQYVELDLEDYAGRVPVELFGRTRFPPVQDGSYLLTLGAHSFYLFALTRPVEGELEVEAPRPLLGTAGPWELILAEPGVEDLREILPGYLVGRRWFAAKDRTIVSTEISDVLAVPGDGPAYFVVLISVGYSEGEPETYLLPLGFTHGAQAHRLVEGYPNAVVARLVAHEGEPDEVEGVLFDACFASDFPTRLFATMERRRKLRAATGEGRGRRTRALSRLVAAGEDLSPEVSRAEQSNTSIFLGTRLILKLYRKLQGGVNPDLEVGRFLTERKRFPHTPAVAGFVEYRRDRNGEMTLGVLQEFVTNQGDAWSYTVDSIERFLEHALARDDEPPPDPEEDLLALSRIEPPQEVRDAIGPFLETARLLGQRTGEMHLALASDAEDPDFRPERFTPIGRRSFYQSIHTLLHGTLRTLRDRLTALPPEVRAEAEEALALEVKLRNRVRAGLNRKLRSLKTRVHGDYHLGQVLFTGRDFVIIDFEGEPARPISERRIKRSPLRDVAGMLRSFHYASVFALHERVARRVSLDEVGPRLEQWAALWRSWIGAGFLASYLATTEGSVFLEGVKEDEIETLLDVYTVEKAAYELRYELAQRPTWVHIPLAGLLDVARTEPR